MKTKSIFDIDGKYVFITGSTRGIGREIAKGFIENGAKVIIHGRLESETAKICKNIGAFDYVTADFSDMNDVYSLVEKLKNKLERLDVLINNAGFEEHCAIDSMTEKMLDNIYNINTKAHYILTSNLVELLKKSDDASIINVTSIHQVVPVRENSPYCMSKAALGMFTQVCSLEFGPLGIRVNNLAPGAIKTEMNAELFKELEEEKGFEFAKWVPLGRIGDAKEMIGPCIFLASKASSYITGTTIYADGGYKENLLRY